MQDKSLNQLRSERLLESYGVEIKKSEDTTILGKTEDIMAFEKGRKAAGFGSKSKDGKYVKTTQGWKRAEVAGKSGSASFGSFKDHSHEELTKLDALAKEAKEKNKDGKTLSKEEQHAMDHHADIESELSKKSK